MNHEKGTDVINQYKKITKKAKNKKDNNIYLNIQILLSIIIIVTCFMFKGRDNSTFEYIKNSYQEFFESDTYLESTFSYNSFMRKMYNELQTRYGQLVTVVSQINGKGSASLYPNNVSTKKYIIEEKGIVPAEGYISSPFGCRVDPFDESQKDFHTGIDIANAKGTFVKAAFDGVVIKADSSRIAGNYIKIQSENNIVTLYAHNQFLLVNEGDNVLAGQVIATMGDTGYATGPHVHFEFAVDNIRYNPIYAIEI